MELSRLDVLVNDAGIGTALPAGGARLESGDGYQLRFAVNYLAPFMLTRLLELPARSYLRAVFTLISARVAANS